MFVLQPKNQRIYPCDLNRPECKKPDVWNTFGFLHASFVGIATGTCEIFGIYEKRVFIDFEKTVGYNFLVKN